MFLLRTTRQTTSANRHTHTTHTNKLEHPSDWVRSELEAINANCFILLLSLLAISTYLVCMCLCVYGYTQLHISIIVVVFEKFERCCELWYGYVVETIVITIFTEMHDKSHRSNEYL